MARAFRRSASSNIELPITPMLDMTFQLLAFLIFTFQPHGLLEGKVEFTLPAPLGKGEEPPEPQPVNDFTEAALPVTVVVKTLRDGLNDGNISALIVQAPEGETTVADLGALRANLMNRQRDAHGAGQIKIAAETKLKYACVIAVMDTCLQAGFPSVGFAPPPDLGVN
jgi:biopolymer transport protein ExbD